MSKSLKHLRELRLASHALAQETPTQETLSKPTKTYWSVAVFVLGFTLAFVASILMGAVNSNTDLSLFGRLDIATSLGLRVGVIALLLYFLIPLFAFILYVIRYCHIPPRSALKRFSLPQLALSIFSLALLLVCAYHYQPVLNTWQYLMQGNNSAYAQSYELYTFKWISLETLGAFIALVLTISLLLPKYAERRSVVKRLSDSAKGMPKTTTLAFSLWLGTTSGELLKRQHKAALAAGQNISLSLQDACKNMLVLGGIGEGKTTTVVHPLLLQLLDQDCGGLIFDIKGDFKHAVNHLASQAGRNVITLGPARTPMNILAGLTPELGASFLKSACLLNQGKSLDSFWVDTAAELCRNSLGVLSYQPEHYSLQGLYRYLFEPEFRDDINGRVYAEQAKMSESLFKVF